MPILSLFRRFLSDRRGNFALTAAALLPMVLGVTGIGVDFSRYYSQRSVLQEAVDAAALASVQELSLSNASKKQAQAAAVEYLRALVESNGQDSAALSIETKVDTRTKRVAVSAAYRWAPFFAHWIDSGVTPITVSATAGLAGETLTCILGLMQPQRGFLAPKSSIHLDNDSVLEASDCAVYSNSVDKFGLRADRGSQASASTICSAGGYKKFGPSSFSPEPVTDCPKVPDPLASRPAPRVGPCEFRGLKISKNTTLKPGVYCDGLTISGNAKVKFDRGVFVIKDGPLIVTDKAAVSARAAGFYLTGPGSIFEFHADTSIDLSAMETGTMAGLLFFEDRKVPHSFKFNPFALEKMPSDVRLHRITSDYAKNLLGTMYLSKSVLLIDANASVAEKSAYTAIVTGRLWLKDGPKLVINSNYTDTAVPVPGSLIGIKPALMN